MEKAEGAGGGCVEPPGLAGSLGWNGHLGESVRKRQAETSCRNPSGGEGKIKSDAVL